MCHNISKSTLPFYVKLLLFLTTFNLVYCVVGLLFFPSWYVGPFGGLGLPSTMQDFVFSTEKLTMKYPKSWRVVLTPHGNHGDLEVFAMVAVPWRTVPNVTFAHKYFSNGRLEEVANWGESRAQNDPTFESSSISRFESDYFSGLLRGYDIYFESPFGIQNIHCQDWYFLNNDWGYAVSFCAKENDWPKVNDVFNEMIASIKPED